MKFTLMLALLFNLSLGFANDSSDYLAGADLYTKQCSQCHGVKGISIPKNVPNLAGQKSLYVTEQLKAFRDGKRPGTVMPSLAKMLNDTTIAEIATHLESLSACNN